MAQYTDFLANRTPKALPGSHSCWRCDRVPLLNPCARLLTFPTKKRCFYNSLHYFCVFASYYILMIPKLFFALFAALLLAVAPLAAQESATPGANPPAILATGMEFSHAPALAQVLAEAGRQNKLVFVDVYAEWCGPCKMMAQKTFKNPEVGAFYNRNFINYKLDAEKGEGPTLSAKWAIEGYPSFVFLNSKGEIVSRGIGFMQPADFINAGKEALQAIE